jgi:hypothetical protein
MTVSGDRVKLVGAMALFILGCVVFTVRGPVRATSDGGNYDFTLVYAASRAWIQGENPYESEAVSRGWASSGGPADRDPMLVRGNATLVYPPPALAILAPVAALPWSIASWVWAAMNTALAAIGLASIARLAGLTGATLFAFFGLGLCMMPLLTTAGTGQTALVVLACTGIGCAARMAGRPTLGGILLGIGGAIKPQLGFLFTVYQAGRLRWKVTVASLVVALALTGIGVGRMQAAGADWLPSWQRNVAAFTTKDDGDPSRANRIRYQLINFAYPLHNFTDDRVIVRLAVYGIAAGLCAFYFVVDLKRGRDKGEERGELVSLGMVSAVTLMVVYHRLYDAALIAFVLALALRGIAARQRYHWITFALALLYAAPFSVLAVESVNRGWAPGWVSKSALGQNLILPGQAWGLVAVALWMIWLRWKSPARSITKTPT